MLIRDISTPLRAGLPTWPGHAAPEMWLDRSHAAGDGVDITHLSVGAHTGTHLDAPRHFLPDGGLVTGLDLTALIGPAQVVQYSGDGPIPVAFFESQSLPDPLPRLLLRCDRNAGALERETFFEDYVGIMPDAAEWLVRRGNRLVGIDYLSIGSFHSGNRETHLTLLGAGVIIVEGLDLRDVSPGSYTLVCLPLGVPCDGSPCRAVLLPAGALPESV